MELRNLRYFVAAAEEESFVLAAERLHVAPSALSRRIRDLEVEIGVDLFERRARRTVLTSAGRAYFDDAKKLLFELSRATDRSKRIAKGEIGTLVVGFTSTALRHSVVRTAFQVLTENFADIELRLELITPPTAAASVIGRSVDAAFLYSRPVDSPLLDSIQVASDEFVLAMPRSHPMATRTELRLADLNGEAFLWIWRDSAPNLYDRLVGACLTGGLTLRIVQRITSEDSRLQLVSAGMGLTFATSKFPAYVPENVVIKPVLDFSMPMKLELAWRRNCRSRVLDRFIEVVRKMKENESGQ
jgi:DNA-binding transcriptional LysR family regulator